jgi:hypothetical protein
VESDAAELRRPQKATFSLPRRSQDFSFDLQPVKSRFSVKNVCFKKEESMRHQVVSIVPYIGLHD